ncbi:MAG TPA: GAP family protein [Thermoleophilaceae bacterium]
MGWIDSELALVALAAMLSPTTLTFSVLTLVLGDRPLRTGFWFYMGALTATLVVGVVAAFVLQDAAASSGSSTPKTWVAILDVVFAVLLLAWVFRRLRQPPDDRRIQGMVDQIRKVASAPVLAILGAGATLANPGGFIPIALKTISELNPSTAQYVVDWLFFALVSLLPLALALVMLLVARESTERRLNAIRTWLEAHVRTIAAVILVLLAASLLRNGIAGLTS